jgi:N-acetylneuraminic acid mutarotase
MFRLTSLRSWLRSLFCPRRAPARRGRPGLEALEARCLPAASLSLSPVALAGPVVAGTYSGPVDTFTESGRTGAQAGDFRAVIDWGDGSHTSFGTVVAEPNGSFEVLGSHVYHEGSYFPTVTVGDTVAGVSGVSSAQGHWSSLPDIAASIGAAVVAGQDGRIYVIGGYNGSPLKTVEAYDPATDTWSRVADMPTARSQLAAVVGLDRRIYAIGGFNGGDLSTVEAYDTVSKTWSVVAGMPTARADLAAAPGPDGRIYAIGGDVGLRTTLRGTVEAYDPDSNTWSAVADLPTPRYYLAAAAGPDGRIYALGGYSSGYLSTVEAYDTVNKTWSAVAHLPTERAELAAAAGPDGRIYAIGGSHFGATYLGTVEVLSIPPVHVLHGSLTAGTINLALTEGAPFSGPVATFRSSNTLEKASDFTAVIHWGDGSPDSGRIVTGGFGKFTVSGSHTYLRPGDFPLSVDVSDPAGDHVSAGGTMNWASPAPASLLTQRSNLAAAVGLNGRIYAIGGENVSPLSTTEVYDPVTSSWSKAADMHTARAALAAAAGPDGRIYALGGYDGGVLNTMEVYDPSSNTWSLAPMPMARADLAAVAGPDGRIYAIGGADGRILNTVEVYDPATNSWSEAAPMPTARADLAAVAGPDGRIYAIGGIDNNLNSLSTVEVYDPATNSWSEAPDMPTARDYLAAAPGPDGRIYALGGDDGRILSTVEAYDPVNNTWSSVGDLPTARFSLAAAAADGRVYAIGGDDNKFLSTVDALGFGPSAAVAPLPASRLVVSGFPPGLAGAPASFTVTAVDALGNTVTGYSGTVSFFATGTAALPAPARLSNGTATFTGTLFTPGLQTLAATDGSISGQEDAIVVKPSIPAQVTVASSAGTIAYGQKLTLTTTVTTASGAPTGSVTFYDDTGTTFGAGTVLGTVSIAAHGKAALTLSPDTLSAGGHSIDARYSGDGVNFLPTSTTRSLSQAVNKAGTTTTLASDNGGAALGSSPAYGTSVTFTASVGVTSPGAGAPTGTVSFYVDGGKTAAATVTLSGGQARWSTTALGAAAHTVKAVYNGDADFLSSSGTATQRAHKADTTTTVRDDIDPSVYGQAVTFTATVTSSTSAVPDGDTVSFFVDGSKTAAATVKLQGGQTIFKTASLSVVLPPHTVKAVFNGDGNHATSGGSISPLVFRDDTLTSLTASKSAAGVGEKVTFTATVTAAAPGGGVPGGSVAFFVDGAATAAKIVPLSSGTARWSTSWSAPGNHTIHAAYSLGTSPTNYNSRQTGTSPSPGDLIENVLSTTPVAPGSPAVLSAVDASAAQVIVTSSAGAVVYGQPLTFTATVTEAGGPAPAGTVTFYDDTGTAFGAGTVLGTAAVNASGQATLTLDPDTLPVGVRSIDARYGGDGANFLPLNTTTSLAQTVNRADTTTTLTSDNGGAGFATPLFGETVTFTATVAPKFPGAVTPTGWVSFYTDFNTTPIMVVRLSGGQAQWGAVLASCWRRPVQAVYNADANFNTSSGSSLLDVNQAKSTTTLASDNGGVASGNPVYGQKVTFTATVTSASAGAELDGYTVSFFLDGSTQAAATVEIKGGWALFQTTTLSATSHTVQAVFNGDANIITSNGSATQTVDSARTTTALTASKGSSGANEPVTFTATVMANAPGGGAPAGKVQFFDDTGTAAGAGKLLDTEALSGGKATSKAIAFAAVGSHTIDAVYLPSSGNFTTSSGGLTQTVLPATKTTLRSSGVASGGKFYSLAGGAVTFTAKVVPVVAGGPAPTGKVTFFVDGVAQAAGLVSFDAATGLATFTASVANVNALALGAHTITATYSGDSHYAGSSAGLTQVVQAVDHLGATMSPVVGGAFSVTVTAYDASGNVVVGLSARATLEVVSGPGGVTGPGSANFVDGQATFANLHVSWFGEYRLRAHLGGLFSDVTFRNSGVLFGWW